MLLVTAEEMRQLDEATIAGLGVPGVVLMESAGRAVVEVIAGRGPLAGRRVAVVCGSGNNGGDGFVIARHLHHRGAAVTALLVVGEPAAAGDARVHFDAMVRSGVATLDASPAGFTAAGAHLDAAEVIVDAMLGTGAARPVTGHLAAVVARINAAGAVRVAVDLPTGLDADTGHPRGACVRADETVTFGFAKVGLCTSPGWTLCGRLTVADIGIPGRLARERGVRTELLDEQRLAFLGEPRSPLSHKGTHGHVVLVAGSRQHPGAAMMGAEAAMRAGAGLVTIAAPEGAQAALLPQLREASAASIGPEPVTAADGEKAWAELQRIISDRSAVAFGPGVARTPGMRRLLERVLIGWKGPLLIDADGLNLLAEDPTPLRSTGAQVVLTPHPAEMGRLAAVSTEEVQADRLAMARSFAVRYGVVVVLKGSRTVIAAPDGAVAINPTGNPGMAGGGTGDALTGVIAALLGNRLAAMEAACAGAFLHGRAGDLARDAVGEVGLLTRDLVAHLPAARRSFRR